MSKSIALLAISLTLIIVIYNLIFSLVYGNYIIGTKRDDYNLPESSTADLSDLFNDIRNRENLHIEETGRWKIVEQEGSAAHWSNGIIGSPLSTEISIGSCKCELVSIDCLDTIKCLNEVNQKQQLNRIYSGILKRNAIKQMSNYYEEPLDVLSSWMPVGKSVQFLTQAAFREWMKREILPRRLPNRRDNTVNYTSYNFCREEKLKGKYCIINEFSSPEEFGIIEEEAMKLHNGKFDLELTKNHEKEIIRFWKNRYDTTAYDYLLNFAHMSRIIFNVRSHVVNAYRAQVRTISPSQGEKKILRVSMHLRRGDSCEHALSGYSEKASVIDSDAQVSGRRHCYKTAVYIEALKRVQLLAEDRHLEVYVSTDHLLDLMDEIKQDFPNIYREVTWKYVGHSRGIFNYSHTLEGGSKFIEYSESHSALGATAFLDVWHLSHGQVFIGHLGSRFGKLSWWQATARYNSLIPFFSVDGHSMCCDIDEACGKISPSIISMENCLTFSRDQSKYELNATEYWEKGAFVRFQLAEDEIKFRKLRSPSYRPPSWYQETD